MLIDKPTFALFEGFLNVPQNERRDKMLDLRIDWLFWVYIPSKYL